MNSSAAALGIDIAKLNFDVCLINQNGKHKVFPNSVTGFEQLIRWLATTGAIEVHLCLEAPGTSRASARSLSARSRLSGQCSESGSHQNLCRGLPVAHQDGQSGCRVESARQGSA